MALLGYDIYAQFSPTLNLAGMSFIFRDRDHAFAFFNSDLHEKAKEEILASTGVRVISDAEWNQGPYKVLMTKKPVTSTDGLRGMPMRVPNNEVDLLVWGERGVGASAVPVPWPEAQLALSQGLVEAIELPADFIIPFSFHESASNVTLTRHRHQLVYMTISEAVWKELSEEEQKILDESSKEAGLAYTETVLAGWEKDQAFLKEHGLSISEIDVTPWHEAIVKLARELEAEGKWEAGLVDKLIALK
jgi:TRAP-type C4-dicarboxylate transport system substrate-binding protein